MNACPLHTYAVDQLTATVATARDGREQVTPGWQTVLQIQAPRAARALRAADAKWPGKVHRARLIQTALHPAHAQLCADDRAIIHQLTQTTI